MRPLRLAVLAVALLAPSAPAAAPPADTSHAVSAIIDRVLADHWRTHRLTPAAVADDATLLRRLTLDLAGRVPTTAESTAFAAERYASVVRLMMSSPEFSWHFGTVLDELIQGRHAGNEAFIGYLRRGVRERKRWDVVFREVLLGPWSDDARKPARLFLEQRARDLDVLTVDTSRAFFGVDISCARCHNHPLVPDWKRDHYYGMMAFLVRTTGGKGNVGEKTDGEAKFAGKDGKERTAPMMFLTGTTIQEPPRPAKTPQRFSRREALVGIALDEKKLFARAFVNRAWEYFFGQGIIHPADQMHSGNPPSVAGLLDQLADDFITSDYDINRLVAGIVKSRAYRLASTGSSAGPGHFAVARLRPLSPRQLSRSLIVALGDGSAVASIERLAALDKQASELKNALDPRTTDFQSSTREALFVSNAEAIRKWVTASGTNLTARLALLRDDETLVRTACRAILSRSPTPEELAELTAWLRRQSDRRSACEDLAWALAASAEFRFNH